MEYMQSRTHENVVNAYRGEVSGELLYLFLSEKLFQEGNQELAGVFQRLSKEEQGHVNALKRHIEGDIKQYDLSSEEIEELRNSLQDPKKHLEVFAAGEKKAGEEIYPYFSNIALEEGYSEIANMFLALAKVEIQHGVQLENELTKMK